jgi:hypothetical protein
MPTAVPLEVANAVWSEINAYIAVMQEHLTTTDERYLDWHSRTEQLAAPDLAGARALCRALLEHLTGNAHDFELAVRDARIANALQQKIYETQLIGYSNLTFATKALGVFRRTVDIKNLNIQRFIEVGVTIGSFQRIDELVTQAASAKLDLASLSRLPAWLKASQILRARNFSDEQCAKVVDVAGEVLRDSALFWLDTHPKVVPDEGQGLVLLRYRVATSPADAAAMTGRMVEKLIDAGLDEAPLMITFVGAQH